MLEKLNKLTNLIYQGALDRNWRPFLDEFISCTSSMNGWLAMNDSETLIPVFSELVCNVEGINHDTFLEEYVPRMHEDPFFIHSANLNEQAFFKGTDIVPMDVLHNSSLYPLLERTGCEYIVGGIPVKNQFYNSFAVVQRSKNQENYSNDDLRLMEMMLPHINRAFTLHYKLISAEQQSSLYKSIVENNPYPLIVVDEKCTVLQSNAMAVSVLEKQTVLQEKNGRLISHISSNNTLLSDFIRSTLDWIQAKSPEPAAIKLKRGIDSVILRAYPVHTESDFNDFQNPCCVLEILSNKEPSWHTFTEEYNLTAKELRTIKLIYEGNDLQTVANKANVSFNTVKSQLLAAYGKIGISSQRELFSALTTYI